MGNTLFFALLMLNKINDSSVWSSWSELSTNNITSPATRLMIWSTCAMSTCQTWVAQAMTFFPYFFRAIRLRQIFSMATTDTKPQLNPLLRAEATRWSTLSSLDDAQEPKSRKMRCVKNREIRYYLYVCLAPGILLFLLSLIPSLNFLPTLMIS